MPRETDPKAVRELIDRNLNYESLHHTEATVEYTFGTVKRMYESRGGSRLDILSVAGDRPNVLEHKTENMLLVEGHFLESIQGESLGVPTTVKVNTRVKKVEAYGVTHIIVPSVGEGKVLLGGKITTEKADIIFASDPGSKVEVTGKDFVGFAELEAKAVGSFENADSVFVVDGGQADVKGTIHEALAMRGSTITAGSIKDRYQDNTSKITTGGK